MGCLDVVYAVGGALELAGIVFAAVDLTNARRRARRYTDSGRFARVHGGTARTRVRALPVTPVGGRPLPIEDRVASLERALQEARIAVEDQADQNAADVDSNVATIANQLDEDSRRRAGDIVALVGALDSRRAGWWGLGLLVTGVIVSTVGNVVSLHVH